MTGPTEHSNSTSLYVVLGGTGGIGRAVVAEAVSRGHRVRTVSRSASSVQDLPTGVEPMDADVSTVAGAAAAVAGATMVIHAAQSDYTRWTEEFRSLTARIADATAAAGAKLVMADNLYMYGPQADDRPFTENTAVAATDSKGLVRAAMAADLLARSSRGELRVAIGRASDYYGPHGTTSALGESFFNAALRGKTVNTMGSVDVPHTMSYLPDIGSGLVTLAERDAADGRAWHLPAAEPLTTRQFADLVATEIGRPVKLRASGARTLRLLGLAFPMLRELAGVVYQWERPFVADSTAYQNAFPDAISITPHPKAVAATVRWWREPAGNRVGQRSP
jgi:nucleoside-diphosphate-sugar epimerase